MSEPLVAFEGVVKRFGNFVAVEKLDLEIQKGEFIAVMGPSGCGKTTTLRMLAGLEVPTGGTIRLSGQVMNDVKPSERDTPMVWQSLALFPFLDARRNVEFGLKMRGVGADERRARAMEWLDRLGIGEFADRDVAQLSGGQRQRVALARALVTEPEILLLDEPLSALDAHLVIRMQGVLNRLQKELGITFVYVTHSQSEAFAMADRVVIMNQGRIEQIGAPRDIYRTPESRFVAEFVGRNNIISGTISDVSQDRAVITTPAGTFQAPAGDSRHVEAGEEITFVVSADLVSLSLDRPDAENAVECQVISEEFVGSIVTLFLETADGTELKAQVQQSTLDAVEPRPGKTLWVSWGVDRVHILPR